MSTLIWKAEPFSEKPRVSLQAIGWQVRVHPYCWSPPTDVYETENGFVVRLEVAGMRQSDYSVSVEKNFLVISGVRAEAPERRAYQRMEIRFGEFNTAVELPAGVDVSRIETEYDDGFLMVFLPKTKATHTE